MQHVQKQITELAANLSSQMKVADGDALEAAEDHIDDASRQLTAVIGDDAYETHVIEFLAEEKRAFQESDGGRSKPLCDCTIPSCPLKKGEIPNQALLADDLADGLRRWRRDHSGDARVLTDAREDFLDTCAAVRSALRQAEARLHPSSGEPAEGD